MGWSPPKNVFWWFFASIFVLFKHMVIVDGFLILVKELGLLTNQVNGLGFLDAMRSYTYCIVNNEDVW
jgi:hypothetical protein